jgi:hypothetical protein
MESPVVSNAKATGPVHRRAFPEKGFFTCDRSQTTRHTVDTAQWW